MKTAELASVFEAVINHPLGLLKLKAGNLKGILMVVQIKLEKKTRQKSHRINNFTLLTKRDVQFGSKNLRFPFMFFFMKFKGENFARVCIIILGNCLNWWYRIFFQQGLTFLENDKNWFSFVFTVLPKHIKIRSPFKYMSVCGRVVKPSGLSTALSSYNRSIKVRVSTVLVSPITFFL